MRAFRCFPVMVNGGRRWEVQVADDGEEFARVAGTIRYDTEGACEMKMLVVDDEENGHA